MPTSPDSESGAVPDPVPRDRYDEIAARTGASRDTIITLEATYLKFLEDPQTGDHYLIAQCLQDCGVRLRSYMELDIVAAVEQVLYDF